MNGPEYDRWEAAMDDELQSLSDNGAWKLTTLPSGGKIMGCRWIYKRKQDVLGVII